MEEKKLTDEEIVKALECMANSLSGTSGYTVDIIPYAIDLIQRLQGENKQLKCDSYRTSWKAKFLEAKKEIERLTEERKTANKHDLMYWFNAYKECVKDYEEYGIKNAELQKQVDELKERAKIDLENEKNWGKIQTKQAVKDTAKEILAKAPTETNADEMFIHWLRERYGVGVE